MAGTVSANTPSLASEGKQPVCGVIAADSPELWGALDFWLQLRRLTKAGSDSKRGSPCPAHCQGTGMQEEKTTNLQGQLPAVTLCSLALCQWVFVSPGNPPQYQQYLPNKWMACPGHSL